MTRVSWIGFAYGWALFLLAFISAGAGHGSYLPAALFGAPLSLIPTAGFFVAPIWWAIVGRLLGQPMRLPAIILMTVHVVAVGLLLWLGNPAEPGDEQWRYFWQAERAIPPALWGGIGLYATGQVVAWVLPLPSDEGSSRCAG